MSPPDPNVLCPCGHRRGTHVDFTGACMWGNHPDRDEPYLAQYREEYDPCPCKEFGSE